MVRIESVRATKRNRQLFLEEWGIQTVSTTTYENELEKSNQETALRGIFRRPVCREDRATASAAARALNGDIALCR